MNDIPGDLTVPGPAERARLNAALAATGKGDRLLER
jgi:hypothetical protein